MIKVDHYPHISEVRTEDDFIASFICGHMAVKFAERLEAIGYMPEKRARATLHEEFGCCESVAGHIYSLITCNKGRLQ